MGFWKSKRGICGDRWADLLDDCLEKLGKDKEAGRGPTMAELCDLVEFCTRGHIIAKMRYHEKDGEGLLKNLRNEEVETYSNDGQIHCWHREEEASSEKKVKPGIDLSEAKEVVIKGNTFSKE